MTELIFESDYIRSTYAVTIPEGYEAQLRSRTFMVPQVGAQLRCFMLCTVTSGAVIDPNKVQDIEQATKHVLYWFPDGSTHECPHYNCTDVAAWVNGLATGRRVGLMPHTNILQVSASPAL